VQAVLCYLQAQPRFSFTYPFADLSFSTCVLLVSRLALVTGEALCSNQPKWKGEVADDFHT
jgi:hypothetical protein